MRELLILLYRDWLEFKKKYISYILLWFSLPMITYLFMVIPLSFYILKVDLMNYRNWASPGIWISSSAILSFMYSNLKLKKLLYTGDNLSKYLKAPISNGQLLLALLVFSVFIGLIQFIISVIITTSLYNDNLNFVQLLLISINVISILIFYSILGLLFAIYVKDDFFSMFIFVIMFVMLFFSLGTLVPIEYSYNKFLILIRNLPIHEIVLNVQSLYAGKTIAISPIVLTNIINFIIFIIVLVISYKKFRK